MDKIKSPFLKFLTYTDIVSSSGAKSTSLFMFMSRVQTDMPLMIGMKKQKHS